jgi:hypothetical protein
LSDPHAARPSATTTSAPAARHVKPRAILAGLLGCVTGRRTATREP